MSAKQGNNRNNRLIRLCRYGIFAALCIIFGCIESFVPLGFIAPGIKLGLSNAIALILVSFDDTKGAYLVNTTRILLSALLFGSPFSLLFSLVGGLLSLTVTALLHKTGKFATISISIAGGAAHNLFQLITALFVTGVGAVYYLPLLIICGAVSGALVGIVCTLIIKRLKKVLQS